jgi:hypothetical protein
MNHPMMKCGHKANAQHKLPDGTFEPACVICDPSNGSLEIDNVTQLSGRKARCVYYGRKRYQGCDYPKSVSGNEICLCEGDSENDKLPFFEHQPTKEFDMFYCGCARFGWD